MVSGPAWAPASGLGSVPGVVLVLVQVWAWGLVWAWGSGSVCPR